MNSEGLIAVLKQECQEHGQCVSVDCAKECRRFIPVVAKIRILLLEKLPKDGDEYAQCKCRQATTCGCREKIEGRNQAIVDMRKIIETL